ESVHHGALVLLDGAGRTQLAGGDVTGPIFPRSSNKLLQAVAMLRAGLNPATAVPAELLALAHASHSGESFHLAGVRRILLTAGLTDADLQNTADLPLDEQERASWLGTGHGPTSLAQNCSGKHAAMLATCVARGWDIASYLETSHPLQQGIAETTAELAGERVAATGVDGCGAPVLGISLTALASAFARIATAPADTPESLVAQANRSFPEYVGGTGRDVTKLISGVPGLIAKDGAEGVYAAALPDGRAVALKIADGAERARRPVLAAALQRLGVDAAVLDELLDEAVVLGHGVPVGRIEPLDLSAYTSRLL
ncbi:MAG: asparaginase, partial [Actinomycetota bacterium]|nr:asparaginase [Actinomycetota bacterium]